MKDGSQGYKSSDTYHCILRGGAVGPNLWHTKVSTLYLSLRRRLLATLASPSEANSLLLWESGEVGRDLPVGVGDGSYLGNF